MMDTDFDLLCDGVNPAEAKRLRKMLAEWCRGDENSFPVQLALLTKAQWRAVARMPYVLRDSQKQWQQDQASHRARFTEQFNGAMDDARQLASDSKKLLDAVQADHRRQIAAQSKTTIEAIDARLKQYDMTVSGYNDVIHGIATQICSKARELEAVARQIQDHLNQGTESWNQAKGDFDMAREKMNEERERLQQRLTKRDWFAYLLVASLLVSFGLMLGIMLQRYPERAYAKWVVTHFVWQSVAKVLNTHHQRALFNGVNERSSFASLLKLCNLAYKGVIQFYRLRRGTGEKAKDPSTFFQRKGLHRDFANYWNRNGGKYKNQFAKALKAFREEMRQAMEEN